MRTMKLESTPRLVAVIDIGSSSARMVIAELDAKGSIRLLEKLNQTLPLGQDVFSRGRIRRPTQEECVRVLRSFLQVIHEYGIPREGIRAVGSSAVQEASNRDSFLDRISMATGLELDVIDDAEAGRLTYLGIQPLLKGRKRGRTLVLEVGGGRTEVLSLKGNQILSSRVLRLGAMRMRNLLEEQHTPLANVCHVLDEELRNPLQVIERSFEQKPERMVLLGGEARFVARCVDPDWDRDSLKEISPKEWSAVTEEVLGLTVDECVDRFHLTFSEAETLAPALLAVQRIRERLDCSSLFVSGRSMRDGLLHEMVAGDVWSDQFVAQILVSARQLGKKYQIDFGHADEVADIAVQLFDELQNEHHLRPRHRVLLHIAALLHEVGSFVASASHHKHSLYLLQNSTIFGLGSLDTRIVANVARYHRRSAPKPSHGAYATLRRRDRLVVQQLSAMLRVADALSRTRGRRMSELLFERSDGNLVIRAPGAGALHLEQHALRVKGQMFEDVFGMSVILVKG